MGTADYGDVKSARSLSRVPLLRGFAPSELTELARAMSVQHKPQGTTIVRQGQIGSRDFYILMEGTVEIREDDMLVATRGPFAVFGEMAFIANRRRTASVVAAEDCVVIRVDNDQVRALLERHPLVAWKLMEAIAGLLCDRHAELDKRVRELMARAPTELRDAYEKARASALDGGQEQPTKATT